MNRGIGGGSPELLAYLICGMRRGASEQFSKGIEQLRVAQRHGCLARSTRWQHYCCPLSYAAQLSFSASEANSNQPSSPMSPQPSPGPSVPPGKHPHKATSKPIALPLGKIGVAIVDDDENFQVFLRDIVDHTRQFRWEFPTPARKLY